MVGPNATERHEVFLEVDEVLTIAFIANNQIDAALVAQESYVQ